MRLLTKKEFSVHVRYGIEQYYETGTILGSGRSPGEENGNPLQYSCLDNSMDRGAWWAPCSHEESGTTE